MNELLAGPYKDTVNLPQTSFNMRANSVQREPQIQQFWQDNKVYESCLQDQNKVTPPFNTLHRIVHDNLFSVNTANFTICCTAGDLCSA